MKRCICCLAQCEDDTVVCPECGYDGNSTETYEHALAIGTRLNGRYVLGGAFSRVNSFVAYYAMDTQEKKRVKIYEYLPKKLMYRLPEEVFIKYYDEKCSARGDKEIAAYYSHFVKMCALSKTTVMDFSDCFAENSTVYYVCQINSGIPLSSIIGNGKRMSVSEALKLLSPVFDCTKKLEKADKWYGCLSPYTIITNDGRITAITGYSYPFKSVNSPFDAPEKQLGTRSCGSYTDVYAIGALIYEAVTGFMPPAPQQRNAGKPLRFPQGISEREKAVIEKALSTDAIERYQSVEQLYADIKGDKPPKKKSKAKPSEIIRKIVLTLASITLIASGLFLINYYLIEPYREKEQASNLVSMVQTTNPAVDPWTDIKAEYPEVEFPLGINPSYADLYAANSDFAGWIKIPGLNIDFAVVQASDNNFYERRDFYKNSTNYGVPFFDYRNTLTSLDRNTIIFGHNMRHDDKIFGTLEGYRDIETFKKSPIITMNTLYAEYKFKIYAVFISNSKASDDNGKVFNYIFTNAANNRFTDYIAEIDKRKFYTTGVDINQYDKILTLSTCCYDFEDARLIVVGRLIREGEDEQVNTSLVTANENPKYPQAYYDAKRIENPYKNDPTLFD